MCNGMKYVQQTVNTNTTKLQQITTNCKFIVTEENISFNRLPYKLLTINRSKSTYYFTRYFSPTPEIIYYWHEFARLQWENDFNIFGGGCKAKN
jgi:hypothetical protein